MRTRAAVTMLGGTLVALMLALAVGEQRTRSATVQAPPPLTSEEMLRLVLPPGAGGTRPGVLAWARYDGASARDGSPEIFIALLYQTAAPFDQTDLRRLVNRVRWDGSRYVVDRIDEPGEVWTGDLSWFALSRWSAEIEIVSNQSEGNPIYTVTYKGTGSTATPERALTVTEMFRPSTDPLWRRITKSEVVESGAGGSTTRALEVRYRFEAVAGGPDKLVADISESTETAQPGGRPPLGQLQLFIETYFLSAGRYRLSTRVIAMIP